MANGLLNQGAMPFQDMDPYDLYDGIQRPYEKQQMLSGMSLAPEQMPPQMPDPMSQGIYQESPAPPIGAPLYMGYEALPQDFGGMENMAAIQANMRNPLSMANTLPNFQDTTGMGFGATAPQTFNGPQQRNSFRRSLINDLLNMMGT